MNKNLYFSEDNEGNNAKPLISKAIQRKSSIVSPHVIVSSDDGEI